MDFLAIVAMMIHNDVDNYSIPELHFMTTHPKRHHVVMVDITGFAHNYRIHCCSGYDEDGHTVTGTGIENFMNDLKSTIESV